MRLLYFQYRANKHKYKYKTSNAQAALQHLEEVEHNRRHCTTIRPSSTWVTFGLLGAHRWLIFAHTNSIKQMHEHRNTNREIQIHREHMGHTWAVTEASWREAGGSCGLLPPLLPPPATPPPTQPTLCHRAYGAQNTDNTKFMVQKKGLAQNTRKLCPKYSCSLLATSSTTRTATHPTNHQYSSNKAINFIIHQIFCPKIWLNMIKLAVNNIS